MKYLYILLGVFLVLAQGCAHHNLKVVGDTTTLTLISPRSENVQLACSLDGFVLHPARKLDDSTWEVQLPSASEFSYFYLVDGKVFVPKCAYTELDDFGSRNCMYVPGM